MRTEDLTRSLLALPVPSGTCMATLIRPADPSVLTRRGVLIVPPFGIEHAASDRFLRTLADYIARVGHVALTIEPVGTGDSSDLSEDVDLVEAYHQAVTAGIDVLCSLGTQVIVVGLRFGALAVASSFARTGPRESVSGVALIEPVLRGRNYRRELLLLGASTSEGLADGWAAPAGSVLRPADLDAINVLSLAEHPACAKNLLLVHGPLTPIPTTIVEAWTATASVEDISVLLDQLVLDDPESGRVPSELITGIAEWVDRLPPPCSSADPDHTDIAAPIPFEITTPSWSEDVVTLAMSDGEVLYGIHTSPSATPVAGVVLLSTGTNPRFGPARLHAVLARRLAGHGIATLRVERRGAGVEGGTLDAYDPLHIDDVRVIDAAAPEILGTANTVIAGMCSGAWSSWHAMLGGLRSSTVVLINQIIFGEDSWNLSEGSPAIAVKTRHSLGDPSRWKAALRGEVRVTRSARNLARYASLTARNRFGSGFHGLSEDLETLGTHRAKVHFIFDEHESGLVYLKMHGSAELPRLTDSGRVTISTVSGAGHVFSSPASVDWLVDTLVRKLRPAYSEVERSSPTGSSS